MHILSMESDHLETEKEDDSYSEKPQDKIASNEESFSSQEFILP